MAGDTSDPHDRDPSDEPPESNPVPDPDPAAFEAMLRSMGVDPQATSAAASAGQGQPDAGAFGPLGPLLGMLGGGAGNGFQWDAARQSALWTAAGGAVEPTVDPIDRIRIEELCRQAASAMDEATGLSAGHLDIQVTTRAGWAAFALDDHRLLFERVSAAMSNRPPEATSDPLSGIFAMLGPLMLSSQAGSLVGQLATRSLATHDWPIGRPVDRLTFISSSIDAFAAEWSIPIATARLHVCLADVVLHSVLRIPHVRSRFMALLERHADAASFDIESMTEDLGRRLGDGDDSGDATDPTDAANPFASLGLGGLGGLNMGALTSFNAAEFLGGAPAQLAVQAEIELFLRPILGYCDYFVAIVGARLLGDNRQVMEAWKRRRVADAITRNAGRLLGPVITPSTYERGAAFIGGVVQRAGSDGLAKLWSDAENLPTPAEIEAPGLWLARIGLDSVG
jgi:putative hydrolase